MPISDLTIEQLRPKSCCCDGGTGNCITCGEVADIRTAPCMRVRHVDWPEEIPSLWVRVYSFDDLTNGFCGEAFVTDQIGGSLDRLQDWSFDFYAGSWPSGSGHYRACVHELGSPSDRVVPQGWISRIAWTYGGGCSLNKVSFYGGAYPAGDTVVDNSATAQLEEELIADRYMPPEWWQSEFQVGDWIFTPTTSNCGSKHPGPTCFRVMKTGVNINCGIPYSVPPSTWRPEECTPAVVPVGGGFGYSTTDSAAVGSLSNDNSFDGLVGSLRYVVSWVISADRDSITLMVERMVGAGDHWTITESVTATFAYADNWWTTGRTVGDYTVGACPTDCEGTADPCWPCYCIADGTTGEPVVLIFCDVSTPLWTATVGLIYIGGGSYQFAETVSPFRAVTVQCMGGDPLTYMITVIDSATTSRFMSLTGALTCQSGNAGEMTDRTADDGAGSSVFLFTNNGGAL